MTKIITLIFVCAFALCACDREKTTSTTEEVNANTVTTPEETETSKSIEEATDAIIGTQQVK